MGALSRSYALAWFDDRRNYAKDELGIRFPAFPQVIALGADQRLPRLTPQAGGTDRHEFSVNQQLAIGRRPKSLAQESSVDWEKKIRLQPLQITERTVPKGVIAQADITKRTCS